MKKAKIEVRVPTKEELPIANAAKEEVWAPLGSIWDMDSTYSYFPEGVLSAFTEDGECAGNFVTLRINYDLKNPITPWDDVADGGLGTNYVPDGDTLYGVSLGVVPRFRGQKVAAKLVYAAQQLTIKLNCKHFILGCRIPEYYKHADIPVEQYITLKRQSDSEFLDEELRFYSRAGMRFLEPIPDYMIGEREDKDSLRYGVVTIWTNPFYHED